MSTARRRGLRLESAREERHVRGGLSRVEAGLATEPVLLVEREATDRRLGLHLRGSGGGGIGTGGRGYRAGSRHVVSWGEHSKGGKQAPPAPLPMTRDCPPTLIAFSASASSRHGTKKNPAPGVPGPSASSSAAFIAAYESTCGGQHAGACGARG
jgi:hypothetical protein